MILLFSLSQTCRVNKKAIGIENIDFACHFDTKMKFVSGGAHSEIDRF